MCTCSVIIPCYNGEEFITRAIESVLKQSFEDYEIILVDNNSSDNSLSIMYDYAKNYPATISVYREYKKGACAARNRGLYHAKGEWLQFLDSDDELLPNKLKDQVKIATDAEADVVASNSYVYKIN